jgi:hypothetical protein
MTNLNLSSIPGLNSDDDRISIAVPFDINFNGVTTSTVFLSSNGYISLEDCYSNIYYVGVPGTIFDNRAKLFVMGADNSWQNAYTYLDTSGGAGNYTFRIRYEGEIGTPDI